MQLSSSIDFIHHSIISLSQLVFTRFVPTFYIVLTEWKTTNFYLFCTYNNKPLDILCIYTTISTMSLSTVQCNMCSRRMLQSKTNTPQIIILLSWIISMMYRSLQAFWPFKESGIKQPVMPPLHVGNSFQEVH